MSLETDAAAAMVTPGMVFLVGAGPGDPGLITVRGLEVLRQADVVVFDRLAGRRLLRHARRAEWIDVGKRPENHPVPQSEINHILIENAAAGKIVARLKGGDPFVFGRGGEEALALMEAGIPFEIVPGVTSAIAVPAYAGIPITQRGLVSSFAVITGHRSEAAAELLSKRLPNADTRVFLMGVNSLPEIAATLMGEGAAAGTPAAVIAWGTTPRQRVVIGTLEDIAQKAADVEPPAVTVVGEVVRLRDRLRWFDLPAVRPLHGLQVFNTRPVEGGNHDRLTDSLEAKGAEVFHFPAFQIQPAEDLTDLDDAILSLSAAARVGRPAYDWLLLTSAAAVRIVLDRIVALGCDVRILSGVKIGAVGRATAAALEERGLRADFIPSRFSGVDMVKEIESQPPGFENMRVLLPRSAEGGSEILAALEAAGAQTVNIPIYAPAPGRQIPYDADEIIDPQAALVIFFSPSAVRGFDAAFAAATGVEADTAGLRRIPAACIGHTTAHAAAEAGYKVVVMPEESREETLVEAIIRWRTRS